MNAKRKEKLRENFVNKSSVKAKNYFINKLIHPKCLIIEQLVSFEHFRVDFAI